MEFMLGANYWASNAGTEMWVNWDEKVVDNDFNTLSRHGIKYLRVFPNWRDFQPVCKFYTGGNTFREYRDKNGNLFDNPYYVDYTMMDKFETLCNLAQKHGLKLIVGIITGWMSGRLFAPPALGGVNLYTDFEALALEQKFVKAFVKRMYAHEAIFAWDLGNECNCLSGAETQHIAESWTAAISNAIRANDPLSKPIVSGMHGLGTDGCKWTIQGQAEYTDILTTHPYPQFVPHCYKDDMLSFRTLLHAACETSYYADIGKKPCFAEEIGTLGPMSCGEDEAAAFIRTNLFSNWANGSTGVLWWCACEQIDLETAPYTWTMLERELGMIDRHGEPKKILLEFNKFNSFLQSFRHTLPKVKPDAVCIATKHQDQWGCMYMSYLLAKQTGLNIEFAWGENELPESNIYMLPSISGDVFMSKEKFDALIKRVQDGATLYISNNTGIIADFERITGIHISNSYMENAGSSITLDGSKIEFSRTRKFVIHSDEAIISDDNGECVLVKHRFGKGEIYYLNFPLESMLLNESYAFSKDYCKIYEYIFANTIRNHVLNSENKFVGTTLHDNNDGTLYAVLINYSDKAQNPNIVISDGYEISERIYGNENEIPANEATVLLLKQRR